MNVLNHIFGKSPTEDISGSLGNMLISGVENESSRKLKYNMLMNFLQEKKTLILANGSISYDNYKRLIGLVSPYLVGGRKGYDFNLSDTSDCVDILSAFETSDQKATYILSLMTMVSDMPDTLKIKAQRFYLYAISIMDYLGKKYTLKDLASMDPDYVADMVEASSLPELEKKRRIRFLTDTNTYSSFLDIESIMIMLESNGVLRMLSGDLQADDLFREGNVIMINGMTGDDFRKKELFFNAFFDVLSKCLERIRRTSKIAFVIEDADFISGDYIKAMLQYNTSYRYATYIFVEDISRYIAKNGNAILDETKSFVVFNQGSDENAAFWSAFFGSRDTQERSFSYTKKKSWNPLSAMTDSGGVIASPRKYNSTTTNVQKVNKPIYRTEIFRELRPHEVMIYLREPLIRRKTRIEG